MSQETASCPWVAIDGMTFDDLEDFADYLPEGVTLNKVLNPLAIHCLCGVDMDATARRNGYRCEAHGAPRFAFTPEPA